jgi:hypothetical protein
MIRYVIGPDVAIRLARGQVAMGTNTRSWLRRFFARKCCRCSTKQYTMVK